MKDEIKEILDYLKKDDDKDCWGYAKDKLLSYEEGMKLVDCITNLQQERNKFKSRNEKARNHIMAYYYTDLYDDTLTTFEDELLNILQGDDKDVKD